VSPGYATDRRHVRNPSASRRHDPQPDRTAAAKEAALQKSSRNTTHSGGSGDRQLPGESARGRVQPIDDAFSLTTTSQARQIALQNALPTSLPRSRPQPVDPPDLDPRAGRSSNRRLSVRSASANRSRSRHRAGAIQATLAAKYVPTARIESLRAAAGRGHRNACSWRNSSYSATLTEQAKLGLADQPTTNRTRSNRRDTRRSGPGNHRFGHGQDHLLWPGPVSRRLGQGRGWMLLGRSSRRSCRLAVALPTRYWPALGRWF